MPLFFQIPLSQEGSEILPDEAKMKVVSARKDISLCFVMDLIESISLRLLSIPRIRVAIKAHLFDFVRLFARGHVGRPLNHDDRGRWGQPLLSPYRNVFTRGRRRKAVISNSISLRVNQHSSSTESVC